MKRRSLIAVSTMCLFDQLIKIIIYKNFMDLRFDLKKMVGFRPHLNTDQLSIFNNELELKMGLPILIILNIVILAALVVLYIYISKKYSEYPQLITIVDLLTAGCICSLIDKVFWGGSLDYILFLSQIIDLKDIYLFLGVLLYFVFAVRMEIIKHRTKE